MKDESERGSKRPALGRTVLALGLVSLLTDAASDMIWPLLPVLLADSMGASASWAGVIEGVADATAALAKYVVGKRSDRLGRRKPFVLAGYGVSSLARPLLALASAPWHALVVRVIDRLGKGLRTAPRDALIAEDTASDQRATAFGYHRAMDNAGAVIGPLLALVVLSWFDNDVRKVAVASAVPGGLAVLALWALVRERAPGDEASRREGVRTDAVPASVERPAEPITHEFKSYLVVVALFALANASDFFIIAQARRAGVSVRDATLLWAALSLVRALAAGPGGAFAERVGKRRSLVAGWLVYAGAYVAFPLVRGTAALLAVTVAYGVYYGLTEGAEKALVATFAKERGLGRSYGLFSLVNGVGALVSSALFAALFAWGDGRWAWWTAAALALLAAAMLARLRFVSDRQQGSERAR